MAPVRRDWWMAERIVKGDLLVRIYGILPYDFLFLRPDWVTLTNQSGDFIRQFVNQEPRLTRKLGRDFALSHATDILQFIEAEILFVSKRGAGRLLLFVEDGSIVRAASDLVDLARVREAMAG